MTMSLVGKRLGNYDIQSQIGEGGMGSVYLGHHPTIGKRVAIKVLHEELCSKTDVVTRFFNEAKAVNDISHPNIVDIIDFGDTSFDGVACKYIIMEYLDGESLATRMRREGVNVRDALIILAQCIGALAASHAKGVIHRDLKPENVYLCNRPGDRNYVKLLDFGIAKLTSDQGSVLNQKTRTGMVLGTPTYMSPEQCDGKGKIDARADIYALGVMMYELLTGRVPFPGDGFGEVLVAHLTREPEPPRSINPSLPPELEAIVLRCLRKRKEDRFQSMNDFLAALSDPLPHFQTFLAGAPAPTAAALPQAGNPLLIAQNPLGTGVMPAMGPGMAGASGNLTSSGTQRSPSALWAVVNPNLPPAMQQMQMQQMQMQMQQMQMLPPGTALMPPMQMVPGGPTGMMLAPGMTPEMMQGLVGGPRVTTLSGASVEQDSSRRRPLNVLFGFLGAMVFGTLLILGIRMISNHRAASQLPPVEALVNIAVKTTPPAAAIYRSDDDNAMGKTPYVFRLPKGGKPVDIKVRLAGFREETRTVNPSESQTLELTLSKEQVAAPPGPSETGSKPQTDKPITASEGQSTAALPSSQTDKPAKAKDGKVSKDSSKAAKDKAAKDSAGLKDSASKDPAEKPTKHRRSKSSGDAVIRPVF